MQRLIRHGERRTFDTGVLREGGNCRSVLYALGVLLVCLLGSYLFLFRLEHVRVLQEREKARYVVDSYATKIQYVVANAFSSAYLVEALLRQGEGRISEFYSYAEELVKMHPSTININLAPRGVVTKVYPFERNKKAIGHDLFANPERSREALLARDSGKATIAGPFDLIQGGYAMAVRLPVFMGEPEGDITAQEKFWGLICVTFAFPDVLDPVKLEYLDKQNYVYQLSRIHPDTGDRIVLLRSAETLIEPVERKVHLPNADWILSVTPKGGWNWSIRYASFGIATFISILFSCVVGLAVDLAHQKKRLELMSEHDPLTGLPNRRVLFRELEKAMEAKRPFALCYMDLDDFKQVNDTYGHDCGDQLLNGFAERLQSALSTAGTLIRLGGDEFIAILYGVSDRCIAGERFRRMLEAIGSEPYHLEGIDLNPAVSMGLALYPSEADSLEALMRLADADMYEHKKRRRCRNGTETSPSADGASCGAGVAHGTGIGIGLFLLLIAANGVGLVIKNPLDGLPVALGKFASFPVVMSLIGLAVIIGLEKMKVPGGILLTIIGVSIVGLIFDPNVHFSGIFAMPSLSDDKGNSLIGSLDIIGALNPVVLPSVLALVMTAVFDATGTIRAVAGQANLLDKDGQIINGGKALTTDSLSSVFSGLVGAAPAAVYIESAAVTLLRYTFRMQ